MTAKQLDLILATWEFSGSRYDAVKAARDFVRERWRRFRRMVPRLQVVVWLKLNYSLMQHSLSELWKKWTQAKEVRAVLVFRCLR